MEVDQANSSPFTAEIEQAAPPKRFSTPSFIYFKGDSNPKSHLKHFKSLMILYKAEDTLMCKVQSERANIIGCDDQIESSAFKRRLPTECELYRELTISPHQTLVEVFATVERYALWDDDRIVAKEADQAAEQASKENGKRRSQPQECAPIEKSYTKFTIPIHQILTQIKDMPWLKKPSPLKGNPTKKDTSRYYTFHEGHGHYTNDCFAWKRHLEDLVRDGHCTEFVERGAIQQIKDCDAANNEPSRKKSYGSTRS
ncbi:unnamed protein product [Prunus armeniaca]